MSWIAPLYGYVVCVIAVITLLVNVSGLIDASFDRANPLGGRNMYGPGGSFTSFESFRATYDQARPTRERPNPSGEGDTLSTAEMRSRYEALRADHVAQVTFVANQRLVKHGLLIIIAVTLFVTHWRWLQRLPRATVD